MKKVVIDARESGTSTGRYIDKLIEYLHELEPAFEIAVLTKAHRLEFMKFVAPNFTAIESTYPEFTFAEQIGFKKQLESLNPDLVHFGMVQQPVLYHRPVVTTVHDLTTVRFRNPSKNVLVFTFKQLVYKWVIKKAAKKSLAVIAPSEFVKQDVVIFTGIDPGKVMVTYEAADKIAQLPEPIKKLDGKQFITYVGRPLPHKNLGRLIDAFAIMQKTKPELILVLAGKKDALYERHERDAVLKGIKNIIFTGFISEGELRWLYENTAAHVQPSLSEGFGLPGLEAMINGAPVVSSNATCLPEVYGNAVEYFDPRSVEDIATATLRIVNNPARAEELRELGQKQAGHYSWQHMAKQTLAVYDNALKGQ